MFLKLVTSATYIMADTHRPASLQRSPVRQWRLENQALPAQSSFLGIWLPLNKPVQAIIPQQVPLMHYACRPYTILALFKWLTIINITIMELCIPLQYSHNHCTEMEAIQTGLSQTQGVKKYCTYIPIAGSKSAPAACSSDGPSASRSTACCCGCCMSNCSISCPGPVLSWSPSEATATTDQKKKKKS